MDPQFRNSGLCRPDKFAEKRGHAPTKFIKNLIFIKNKNFQSRLKKLDKLL